MEEALLLIASLQTWIYLLLLFSGLIYLRLALKWQAEVRRSQFGLERESAGSKRNRAVAMLGLIIAAAASIFAVSVFLVPRVPAAQRPTPVPTISLLDSAGSTVAPQSVPSSGGCLNEQATITSPSEGDEIRGLVEVIGTANVPNFAFYKIEVRPSEPSALWQVITAGTDIKIEDVLGSWDTSLVENGVYLLQLVVTDTVGNAPFPCAIEVVVLPAAS